jgi:hypothetical protein
LVGDPQIGFEPYPSPGLAKTEIELVVLIGVQVLAKHPDQIEHGTSVDSGKHRVDPPGTPTLSELRSSRAYERRCCERDCSLDERSALRQHGPADTVSTRLIKQPNTTVHVFTWKFTVTVDADNHLSASTAER